MCTRRRTSQAVLRSRPQPLPRYSHVGGHTLYMYTTVHVHVHVHVLIVHVCEILLCIHVCKCIPYNRKYTQGKHFTVKFPCRKFMVTHLRIFTEHYSCKVHCFKLSRSALTGNIDRVPKLAWLQMIVMSWDVASTF